MFASRSVFKRFLVSLFVFAMALFIAGCADAGSDQTLFSGDKVILDGSGSTPSSGYKIIKYSWKQLRGKRVDLKDKNSAKAYFIAPSVSKSERLQFRLTVTEKSSSGRVIKSRDRVNITIKPKDNNNDTTPPVITINGENPYNLEAGNSFSDPGATAVDETDGNVTITKSGKVNSKVVGEYKIIYTAKDKSGNEANATRVVKVVDTTPPAIKVLGDNPLTVEYDSNFSDPGVTTSDNAEGNISVEKEGSVDTKTLGEYKINYTATDASGNEANATRVVKVVDTTPPTITLNGDKNISLYVGDSYTEEGASAVDNVDGDINVTISGSVDTSKEGNYTITYTAADKSGNQAQAKRYVEVKKKPVTLQSISISPQNIELRVKGEASFKVLGNYSNGTQKELDGANLSLADSSLASIENSTLKGVQEGNTTLRAELNNHTATANVIVYKELNTSNFNGAEFGSEYTDKIPPNATKEQYDQKRFCMITGRVVDENNQPLEGVKVWLLHHKEYGSVSTDSNGTYVLPSEGGVNYTIRYQKQGYLTVDREFSAPIQDWAVVKEAQLLPKDEKATQIDLNASKVELHSSTPTVDDRGERSTTLVFNGVSKATVTKSDGSTRELKSFKVRATEFKTLQSMPKEMPSKSAFTYCSDLTIDGVSDDANVSFDKPVVMYVDNFLGFNVGEIVPIGYYDRVDGKWKPSKNGVVVKLLDTDGDGKVDALDSDGDDKPNDLNGDGSFSDEVVGIAGKSGYEPGKTYWRGEITHFTPWDFNWPYAPPKNAKEPVLKNPDVNSEPNKEADCQAQGFSHITVKGRVFHEDIPIAGTNLTLHYASNRVSGFKYAISTDINTNKLPDSVETAKVEIFVAGKHYEKELHAGDDGHIEYIWDGKDELGNRVSGKVQATIKVTYLYPLVYYSASSDWTYAWNKPGSASTNVIGREKVAYSSVKKLTIDNGSSNKNSNIAEGWSFSNVNDLGINTVYKGDGTKLEKFISLEDGLIACYRFEGNAKDSSGQGNNGIVHGNLKYEDGVIGKAAKFDGTSAWIEIPQSKTLSNLKEEMTISFWTKYYKVTQGAGDVAVHISNGGGTHSYGFFNYSVPTHISFYLGDKVNDEQEIKVPYDAKKPLDEQEFAFITFVVNNKTLKVYKNGILVDEQERKHFNISEANSNWSIGSLFGMYYLNGYIDSLRIYNKALMVKEIQNIYQYEKRGVSTVDFNNFNISDNSLEYQFSQKGQHIATKALGTNVTLEQFTYDESGHLTAITDQFNQTTQIIRDERGYPTQIIAPNGQITNLTVDENGDLAEVSYEDGSKYQFSYYAGSLLKDMVDLGGHTIGHLYDKYGRFVKEILPNGGALEFARVKEGNTTTYTQTYPEGDKRVIKDTLLANGDINSTITLPSGDDIYMSFANNYFNKTLISNGVKSAITYSTDSFSKQKTISSKTITMPSSLSKSISYNTSYDGNDTVINSKTQTITTNSKTTTITTNYQEGIETITSAMGKTITRNFDIDTLLTKELKFNNLEPINYTYNDKGQITQVTQGDRSVNITYDDRGNIASITNPLGLSTTYEYDNMDRVIKTTYPNNVSLTYSYDNYGNIIKRVVPVNKEHKFNYNFASNPLNYTTPNNNQTSYLYDKANRLRKITKPDNSEIDYTYTKGRLTQIKSPNKTINYTYAFNNLVSSISNGNIELNFNYDGNLLTKQTSSYTQSEITYTYNNDFLVNSITYAGKKEDITYNTDNEAISIGNYQINRDNNGFVSKVNDSNYQKEYSYNNYGEITQIKDNTLTVNLTRNKLSQIIKKEEIINNKTKTYEYAYDKLGRLIKVTKDGNVVEEYSYDENSNRINAKINGKNINANYNSEDQLTSYNNTTYTYDKNGNLIKKQNDTNQTIYTYDEFNNLKAVTLPNNKTISYITNPLNQRVAKLVNGEIKEKYQWKDLTTLLAIYDKDNNLIQRFEYANGRMPIAMTDKNNNRYYLHYDQVGSLRVVTDSNGNIVKEITYDSYGNIISDTNPDFKVPFGFAGGLYDEDTKLVHFGYREYDPVTGRWLSKDPLLFGGRDSNLYGYVLQDPVNGIDPTGLSKETGVGGCDGKGTKNPYKHCKEHPSNPNLIICKDKKTGKKKVKPKPADWDKYKKINPVNSPPISTPPSYEPPKINTKPQWWWFIPVLIGDALGVTI